MDITLVKYIEDDFDSFKRMVSDEETMRFITGIVWTEDDARIQFDAMLQMNTQQEK